MTSAFAMGAVFAGIVAACVTYFIIMVFKSKPKSPTLEAIEDARNSHLLGCLFVDESTGEVYADFQEDPVESDADFVTLELKRVNPEADISTP